jgi:hypothetical protein
MLCQRAVRERQAAINFPGRIDVPFAVFDDFGELPGSIVWINFRSVEAFLRGWDAKRF